MTLLVKDGGIWKPVSALHIKRAGEWKRVTAAFVRKDGIWSQFLQDQVVRQAVSTTSVPSVTSYFTDAELDDPLLPKRLTIPPGVDIAAPANSNFAMSIRHRGWKGDLIIDNYGKVSGRGGTVALGVGGNALNCNGRGTDNQRAIWNNYDTLRAGGGPGGLGGQGGPGLIPYPYYEGPAYDGGINYGFFRFGSVTRVVWPGVYYEVPGDYTALTYGDWTYYAATQQTDTAWSIGRYQTRYNPSVGGNGGQPGRGQGSDGAAAPGASGAAGGTNAGAGGTGGGGGGFGSSGVQGGAGGSGNNGAGSPGAPPGLAGFYLTGQADLILNNLGGQLLGRVS